MPMQNNSILLYILIFMSSWHGAQLKRKEHRDNFTFYPCNSREELGRQKGILKEW